MCIMLNCPLPVPLPPSAGAGGVLAVRPGVLDLAVGKYVYDQVRRSGELHVIDGFFHELRRYG
jgi:hypothetical protein